MNRDEFRDELRAQLLDAAARELGPDGGKGREPGPAAVPDGTARGGSARRRRWRVAALAAAAVLAVVVSVGVLVGRSDRPVSADVTAIVDGDDVLVRLSDLRTRPDEIEAAAERVGLDLRVTEVPVGPSNVGRFIGAASDAGTAIRPIDGFDDVFTGFRVARDTPGTVSVALGRAARAGEAWAAASDALAPGEALACEPLLGERVSAVAVALAEQDLAVRWFMAPAPGEVASPDGYGSWRVVQIEALGPDQVVVTATADGAWPFPGDPPELSRDC